MITSAWTEVPDKDAPSLSKLAGPRLIKYLERGRLS